MFLLPLFALGATKIENKIIVDKSFRVDSSTTSLDTVFVQSETISFDADTIAVCYELTLDSASKLSSPTKWGGVNSQANVTMAGDIQLATPLGTTVPGWTFGTNIVPFTTKTNSGALVAFSSTDLKALIPPSAPFGKLWLRIANPSATLNFRGSVKVWLIKKYRGGL